MIHCQHCGKENNHPSNFCRYCGAKFAPKVQSPAPQRPKREDYPQRQQDLPIEQKTPRPYSWKTDEFDLRESSGRKTSQIEDMAFAPPPGDQQMTRPLVAQHHPAAISHGYRCPRCGTESLPFKTRKISSGGWTVFAILLIFFFPLFWVGFLIKEDVLVCSVCDARLG